MDYRPLFNYSWFIKSFEKYLLSERMKYLYQFYFMENEIIKCIKERRSIRRYLDKDIPKELIEKIIEAGRYAPSAEDRQPWRFIVITNKEKIRELSNEVKNQIRNVLKNKWKWKRKYKELKDERLLLFLNAIVHSRKDIVFYDAPVVIFILTDDKVFNDESCACSAQNMMLAAWSMGIGSCWVGFAKFLELSKDAMQNIGIPDGYHIASCLIFGYPAKVPRATIRKPIADIIKWID